jgi:hypothetical protein
VLTTILLAVALLPTPLADYAGACLAGHPEMGPALHRIALRESRGAWVSVHQRDARWSAIARDKALNRGWLSPLCPFTKQREGWASRGRHAVFAAYSMRFLGGLCLPPSVLDIPIASAFVAARRASAAGCDRAPRCRSWRSK